MSKQMCHLHVFRLKAAISWNIGKYDELFWRNIYHLYEDLIGRLKLAERTIEKLI